MTKKIIKNLYPKFNSSSRIPNNVIDIINDTLENPVKIFKNYKSNNKIRKQISAFDNNKHILEYKYYDNDFLDNYFTNYKKSKKNIRKKLHLTKEKKFF